MAPWFTKEAGRGDTPRTEGVSDQQKRCFRDVQDAFLMRRSSNPTVDATSPALPRLSASPLALQQQQERVFQKLERASQLRTSGQIKEALALYENALDEGLQICRRLQDQTLLKARLLQGMSEAEAIKTSMKRQSKPNISSSMNGEQSALQTAILTDFYVDPSALAKTRWKDIAGLDQVKQSLQENVILPLVRPDLFLQGLRRPQNILLYGPPGTGKTMLVRACAHESQRCNLFVCSASNLVSKWMGESEKILKCLFDTAQTMAPSIIFVDEVDSILSSRKSDEHEASRRLKTEFMILMDGIKQRQQQEGMVLVISCTNCPWDIDEAVIRRFPRTIYVPVPDSKARKGLIHHLLPKAGKHSLSTENVVWLVEQTKGWSCSDITALASEASYGPLRSLGGMDAICKVKVKDVRPLSIVDFEKALKQQTKSVSTKQLKRFSEWKSEHSST